MLPSILRLMRPTDWTKNIFVLPAFLFSLPGVTADAENRLATAIDLFIPAMVAFIAFCVLSSGFYALNDVLDVEKDRLHPVKRHRPVASGEVPVRVAVLLGLALVAMGLAIGLIVGIALGLVLLAYVGLQVGYNLGLKRVMFVDVTILALGFALRAAAGAVAINVQLSVWLLLCVFFLCLYLAFVKRLCDLASAEREGNVDWESPAGYDRRDELNWLLSVSGVLAVVTYLMYSLSDQTWAEFGVRSLGFALLIPFVLISIHRFYRRASHGLSDSPFEALTHDRAVLASVLLFVLGVCIILFVPGVERVFESVFYLHDDVGAHGL